MRDLAAVHRGLSRAAPWLSLSIFALIVPGLFLLGQSGLTGELVSVGALNTWGKYLSYAIMAIGLDLVWGYAGMLSLCQMLFFTIGGYALGMYLAMHGPLDGDGIPHCLFVVTSEVSGVQLPWFWRPFASLPLTVLLLLAVPAAVAFVFGWFAFRSRVRGVYFSIITQALTIAFWLVFCRNETRLCGTNGLTNFTHIVGFDLRDPGTKLGLYLATVGAVVGAVVLARWLSGTRTGRVLIAVRDNESRLRFAGYQPVAYKTMVFALSAALAGLGGALCAAQNGIMTPEFMTAKESIVAVVMVALGGRGTIYGAIVGALVYKYLENRLSTTLANNWIFVLGGLFVGVVLFLPDGLVGAWRQLGAWLQTRGSRRNADPATPVNPVTT